MIKINLLPKVINEKRVIRATAVLFGALLAAIVVGGMAYGMKLHGEVADMEAQAAQAEANQKRVEAIESEATSKKSSIGPIKEKLDFINEVLDYNTKYPALFEEVAKWTYDKVSYSQMQTDGTKIAMTAKVKNLDDLGRYLLNMYRATDLFTSVDISGVPGYGANAGAGTGGAPGSVSQGSQISGSMASLAGMSAIDIEYAGEIGRAMDFVYRYVYAQEPDRCSFI